MTKFLFLLILTFTIAACGSKKSIIANQKEIFDISGIPYYNIPAPSDKYTPAFVAARMIDGLGFRYYWATQGLRTEDLAFKTVESAKSCEETIDHIYELSIMIHNWVVTDEVLQKREQEEISFEIKRAETLQNLLEASVKLKSQKINLKKLNKKLKNGTNLSFWYAINGPISDAIWHSGQVVMMRRASGNAIPQGVNVLMGTKN